MRHVQRQPLTERDILRKILEIVRDQKQYHKSSLTLIREHISPSDIAIFERTIHQYESQERTFEIKFAMLTKRAGFLKKIYFLAIYFFCTLLSCNLFCYISVILFLVLYSIVISILVIFFSSYNRSIF